MVLPIGKVDGTQLNAVLPSEKWMIILAVVFQIMWNLLKFIGKKMMKEKDTTEQKLDRLFVLVHKMEGQLSELATAPTETEIVRSLQPHIELAVHKAVRSMEGKNKF